APGCLVPQPPVLEMALGPQLVERSPLGFEIGVHHASLRDDRASRAGRSIALAHLTIDRELPAECLEQRHPWRRDGREVLYPGLVVMVWRWIRRRWIRGVGQSVLDVVVDEIEAHSGGERQLIGKLQIPLSEREPL